jgi:hypothetical protein
MDLPIVDLLERPSAAVAALPLHDRDRLSDPRVRDGAGAAQAVESAEHVAQ